MKFEYQDENYYFLNEGQRYKVQHEDIQRLKLRPGTRVLRFLDRNDKMVTLPLTSSVGEVEGYKEMIESI